MCDLLFSPCRQWRLCSSLSFHCGTYRGVVSALTENRGRVVSILILEVDASVVLCGISMPESSVTNMQSPLTLAATIRCCLELQSAFDFHFL
jgi:hypothetical protein